MRQLKIGVSVGAACKVSGAGCVFAAVEVDEPSEVAGVTGVVGLTNMVLSGVDGPLLLACVATIDGSAGPLSLTHPTINKIKVMHSKA